MSDIDNSSFVPQLPPLGGGLSSSLDRFDALLSGFQEEGEPDDSVPSLPYIAVSRTDLLRVLKLLNSFPAKSTLFFGLSTPRRGFLRVYGTNKDAVLDAEIPIHNPDHYVIPTQLFLNIDTVIALVAAYPRSVFTFDPDGIHFQNPYVDSLLETYDISEELLGSIPEPNYDALVFHPLPLTARDIELFSFGFDMSFRLADSTMSVLPTASEAYYTLYLMRRSYNSEITTPFIIRKVDIPSLRIISDQFLSVALTPSRIVYRFLFGYLSFAAIPYDTATHAVRSSFSGGSPVGDIVLNTAHTKTAIRLASTLSTGAVTFESLDLEVFMVAGNSRFLVGTGTTEVFSVALDIFGRLLSVFPPEVASIPVHITEYSIDLELGDSFFFSLSRTASVPKKEAVITKLDLRTDRSGVIYDHDDSRVLGTVATDSVPGHVDLNVLFGS